MNVIDAFILGLEVAEDAIPIVRSLITAIVRIAVADGEEEQLAALQTAAEAVKARMDELKFPNEPNV